MFNAFLELFFDHIYHFMQAVPSEMKDIGFAEKDKSSYWGPIMNVYY